MTTIVYKDGILAADSRAYAGHPTPIGMKRKIFALEDGSMVGISTCIPGLGEALYRWFESGRHNDHMPAIGDPKFTALHITKQGHVFFYNDSYLPSGPMHAPFYAIGSGDGYALGALHAGATAHQAVKIGTICDIWSGMPIFELKLGDKEVSIYETE